MLVGGFSSTQAAFANHNYGCIIEPTADDIKAEIDYSPHLLTYAVWFDFNQLYPSSIMNEAIPWKDFITYHSEDNSARFRFLKDRLTAVDHEYFATQQSENKLGFIIDADFSYKFEDSVENSIDLSSLPYLKKVKITDLSEEQQQNIRIMRPNATVEPVRLVSSHEKLIRRQDFVASFFYLITFCSLQLIKIHKITQFKTAPLFTPYFSVLQNARSKTKSKLMATIIKNICNCIPGKFHQVGCSSSSSSKKNKKTKKTKKNKIFFFFSKFFFFFRVLTNISAHKCV